MGLCLHIQCTLQVLDLGGVLPTVRSSMPALGTLGVDQNLHLLFQCLSGMRRARSFSTSPVGEGVQPLVAKKAGGRKKAAGWYSPPSPNQPPVKSHRQRKIVGVPGLEKKLPASSQLAARLGPTTPGHSHGP